MSVHFPRKNALLVAVILAVMGVAGITARESFISEERIPEGDSVWRLTWNISVDALKKGALIKVSPPWNTKYTRIFAQNVSHPGARVQSSSSSARGREIVAVATRSGQLSLDVMFDVHVSANPRRRFAAGLPLSPIDREAFLESQARIQVDDTNVKSIADALQAGVSEPLLDPLLDYVRHQVGRDAKGPSDAASVIREGRGNPIGRTRAVIALCRAAKIPARMVTGFVLREETAPQPRHWLEVYVNDSWVPVDIEYGYVREVPPSYLPVKRGGDSVFTLTDADIVDAEYTVSRMEAPPGLYGEEHRQLIDILDLERLPVGVRETLAILLLLPFGALVTTIVRTVLGVDTFGTFTPTLLALAATAVDWQSAVLIFLLVATISIGGRSLLPRFKLSRPARLSIVFSLVALSLALGVSLMEYYELSPGGESVLLPIVVLTTLVDRIYTVADNKGVNVALVRLAWTFVTACFCFLILVTENWGEWVVGHPEVHLITIALVICARLYGGPKLNHQPWMRWIVEPVATPSQSKVPIQ